MDRKDTFPKNVLQEGEVQKEWQVFLLKEEVLVEEEEEEEVDGKDNQELHTKAFGDTQ